MVYIGKLWVECSLGKPTLTHIQGGGSCKWTNDSQRFLLEHFDIVHNSPSQVYHSALPFCPSSSWLHECYNAELSHEVKVVKGLPTEWGMCSRTISIYDVPFVLTHSREIIAVGLQNGGIIILNEITGYQVAVLSRHTSWVESLAFSSDGTLLVSGGGDTTVNLWDVQTGGVVRAFFGHTHHVLSVSISSDCTIIASGSPDMTIRLWDIQTGECNCVIRQSGKVTCVNFSPLDPQLLLSVSEGGTIRQWGPTGHQVGPEYTGNGVVFCPDGTCFLSWGDRVITVRNSDSRVIVAEFQLDTTNIHCCCFSPDSRLVAAAVGDIIHIWDISSLNPHLIKMFGTYSGRLTSITLSSSLISSSLHGLIKFWQIGALSAGPVIANPNSNSVHCVNTIKLINLQVNHGIAITINSDGVVKIWDIITGHHRQSFRTSAGPSTPQDAQLINGRLITVLWADRRLYIQDTEKGEFKIVTTPGHHDVQRIRLSGDGSRVFCLEEGLICAWSTMTGEVMGEVELGDIRVHSLTVDGSSVWIHSSWPKAETKGWDFGIPGSPPVLLPDVPQHRHRLCFVTFLTDTPPRIRDTVTGKKVLQLPARFSKLFSPQWDGRYLVAGCESEELLILDLNHALPSRDL